MEDLTKKKSIESRDYKERFEFVFTTGGNIICQRYFRINNFNPKSLRSYELTSAVRECAATIDRDLKEKTQVYLETYAPTIFSTKEEMESYISNKANWRHFRLGHGIVVRNDNETDYAWVGNGQVVTLGNKFDNGELSTRSPEENKTTYKFAFKVDGREVCAITWEGNYPKFIKDKIDLSNKWGRNGNVDIDRLSMEQYLLYKMGEGKTDLVYGLIKNICIACSESDNGNYTTEPDEIIKAWNNDSEKFSWRAF